MSEVQRTAEKDALGPDEVRRRQAHRFRDVGVSRVAFRVHEVYHDGLRCRYECDFWHGLVVALHEVESSDLLVALAGPDARITSTEVTQ